MKSPLLIHEVAPLIQRGELSPEDLLQGCLRQIDRYEDQVRAWVFVARDEAREQARTLTEELKRGNCRGPLHGIPIAVKDIIDVKEWPTAAGSKRWANAIARDDAPVVKQLRDAGCVLIGKTVTTAFASFDPPVTRNPWDLSKTPGGSSSGSAAAVACGMCLGALATQTGGSITRPASYCGVYSLKLPYGEVSTEGVVPLAESMDHVGVMANCVRDLAMLASSMLAYGRVGIHLPDPTEPDDDAAEEWFEIGRLRGLFDEKMQPEMREPFERLCAGLQTDRLRLVEQGLPASFARILEHHLRVMSVEAAIWHGSRFRRYPEDYPVKVRSLIEDGLRTSAAEYAETKAHQESLRGEFYPHTVACLDLTPATTGPAVDAGSTGDPAMNSPWSYLGYPTISMPFAWTEQNLPLAVQLVGRGGTEEFLFEAALELEAHLQFPRRDLPL